MIFINALIWKRWIEFKNSKKMIIFLLLPFICFFLFYFLKTPNEKVVFYFPIIVTYLGIFVHWNPENLVYSGCLLSTPLTPKKNWIDNALIISITGYIYSYISIAICLFILKSFCGIAYISNMYSVYYSFLNLPLCFALSLSTTLYFADYSSLKQFIQIPFSLFGFAIIVSVLFFPNILPVDFNGSIISILFAIVIIAFCFLINIKIVSEKLFINTKKLLDAYSRNIIED